MNPVMLKELRQAVRNNFVLNLLIGSLLAQIGVVLAMHLVPGINPARHLVAWLQYIVIAACTVCLPIYAGARLAVEIWSGQAEFYYNTALRADEVICGKLAATRMLIIMFASTVLPLTTLAYVMRGISLYAAVGLAMVNVVCALTALHVAVLAGSSRGSRVARYTHLACGALGVAVCAGAAWRLTTVVSERGIAGLFALVILSLIMLTIVLVTRALAIANFSPLQQYRSFTGTVMAAQVLALWSIGSVMCAPFGLTLALALLIGAAERQTAFMQTQRRWSASRLPRWVAWWMARRHYRRWAWICLLAPGLPYLILALFNLHVWLTLLMFVLVAMIAYKALSSKYWQSPRGARRAVGRENGGRGRPSLRATAWGG